MVEKIIINPNKVRGYGNIMNQHSTTDYTNYACTLTEETDTINGQTMPVYEMEDTILFWDKAVTNNSKLDYWYWNTNYGTGSVSDDGTTFNPTTTSILTVSATLTSPATSSIYVYDFPLTVEFDIVSYENPTGVTDYPRVRVYNSANNKIAYWSINDYGVGHYKIVCTEGSQKLYYNGVEQSRSFTFTPTTAWSVSFQTKGNIKYKNFKIYEG